MTEGDPKQLKAWIAKEAKRFKDNITKMKNEDGELLYNEDMIIERICRFYKNLYENEEVDPEVRQEIINDFDKCLSKDSVEALEHPITSAEVQRAIEKLNLNSAPGPDGLTSHFYNKTKSEASHVLADLFQNIAEGDDYPDTMQETNIRIIPKPGDLTDIKNWRPVSLINTDQKILSHVLAERLKPHLSQIIHPDQMAYLSKRSMNAGILFNKAVIQKFKRRQNNLQMIALDFSKAFDRVDRTYLLNLLSKIGIPENLLNIITAMYSGNTANILINGKVSRLINIKRGVRQGCPVSALLFIIALEPLLDRLRKDDRIRGIVENLLEKKLSGYADDLTVYTTNNSLPAIMKIVRFFCQGTQFKINEDKTEVLFIGDNSNASIKILGVKLYNDEGTESDEINKLPEQIVKSNKALRKQMSTRARASASHVFILSKMLHQLRFSNPSKKSIDQAQGLLIKKVTGKRHFTIKREVLYRNTLRGGIRLPCIDAASIAAKIADIYTAILNNADETLREFTLNDLDDPNGFIRQNIKRQLSTFRLEFDKFNGTSIILKDRRNGTFINAPLKYRQLYDLIINRLTFTSGEERVDRAVQKYGIDKQHFYNSMRKMWQSKNSLSHEKNIFYEFAYNSIRDKKFYYSIGHKNSHTCFLCKASNETVEHLVLHCPFTRRFRVTTGLTGRKDLFCNDRGKMGVFTRYIATLVLGSWGNTPDITRKMLAYITTEYNKLTSQPV